METLKDRCLFPLETVRDKCGFSSENYPGREGLVSVYNRNMRGQENMIGAIRIIYSFLTKIYLLII